MHPIISRLIDEGAWPTGNLNNISEAAVRSVAPDEERLCLMEPENFRTVQDEATNGVVEFWQEFGALTEIAPERYLIVGDFGLGSDAPIVIEADPEVPDPKVLRLQWRCEGHTANTHWVPFFDHLSEFATFLYAQRNTTEEAEHGEGGKASPATS
jgi:hypothetical protein